MDISHLKRVKAQVRLQESCRSSGRQLFCGLEKFCRHTIGRDKAEIATLRFASVVCGDSFSEFAEILAAAQTYGDIQDGVLLRVQQRWRWALRLGQKNVSGENSRWL